MEIKGVGWFWIWLENRPGRTTDYLLVSVEQKMRIPSFKKRMESSECYTCMVLYPGTQLEFI
jgi:hypothetical protein